MNSRFPILALEFEMAGMNILKGILKIFRAVHRQNRSGLERFSWAVRRPLVMYSIIWTMLLAAVVTIASLTQELAFTSTFSSSSHFSKACPDESKNSNRTCYRMALDRPGDVFCLPAQAFSRSAIDYLVPPIFATLVVLASASFVHAAGLWEI
ncbi:hypothetical protein SUGI_0621550 [Cryptomeria japonica]|nr:hypothetical protein SUGI_0621550 [Cryptomeria japonica]